MTTNNFFIYDQSQSSATSNLGSPNIPIPSKAVFTTNFPDWISPLNNKMDLRAFYQTVTVNSLGASVYTPKFTWPSGDAVLGTVSTITKQKVQFTTESIFYAQSAYFVTIVMVQWSNVFACKSRKVFLFLS